MFYTRLLSPFRFLARLRLRAPGNRCSAPSYAVSGGEDGVRTLAARGKRTLVGETFFQAATRLRGPLGLVLVEDHGAPREWTSADEGRAVILEALLQLRDLLGRGGMDVGLFSAVEGVELFLDRFGSLDVRCVSWRESEMRRILDGLGFRRVPRISVVPSPDRDRTPWSPEDHSRFARVRNELGMQLRRTAG